MVIFKSGNIKVNALEIQDRMGAAMKSEKAKRREGSRQLSRVLLVQIIPFVLMLVVSSWLTLQAGQRIEQQRSTQVQIPLARF
jgi:hypothetical protein